MKKLLIGSFILWSVCVGANAQKQSVDMASKEAAERRLETELRFVTEEKLLDEIRSQRAADQRRHSDYFDSFVGKNISALAASNGAPTAITHMPKGEVIYVWETLLGDGFGCRTSIFTKKNGLIYSWQWSGNSCRRKN